MLIAICNWMFTSTLMDSIKYPLLPPSGRLPANKAKSRHGQSCPPQVRQASAELVPLENKG